MKKKMKIMRILTSLAIAAFLFAGSAFRCLAAEPEPEYSISIACSSTEYTAIGTNTVINFNYAAQLAFKNYVEAASNGRIAVNIYTNSALGNASEILLQCMQGVIECSTAGDSDLSNYYPNIQVFSIPYVFDNRIDFYEFLDGAYTAFMVEEIAQSCGVRIVAAFDNGGFRNFSNNVRQIHTAEDLKGLKIRCMQSASYITTLETLGATPTALAFSELYSALQTGVVDGQENAPLVMLDNSIYEQQKYYSLDGHSISPAFIIVNESWLRSLPEELQTVVLDGGKMAQTAARGTIGASEGLALNLLTDKGVEVYAPSAEEKETFKVVQEPVIEWLKGEIGEEPVDAFVEALAQKGQTAEGSQTAGAVTAAASQANVIPYIVAIVVLVLVILILAVKMKKSSASKQEE